MGKSRRRRWRLIHPTYGRTHSGYSPLSSASGGRLGGCLRCWGSCCELKVCRFAATLHRITSSEGPIRETYQACSVHNWQICSIEFSLEQPRSHSPVVAIAAVNIIYEINETAFVLHAERNICLFVSVCLSIV